MERLWLCYAFVSRAHTGGEDEGDEIGGQEGCEGVAGRECCCAILNLDARS